MGENDERVLGDMIEPVDEGEQNGGQKLLDSLETNRIKDAEKAGRKLIREEDGIQKEWYEEARKMTVEQLPMFLKKLVEDYQHDYGTICHAVAAGALSAAHAVNHSPTGGITGFQAGAIMWEFIAHWQGLENKPLRLLNYEDMLYPQHAGSFTKISKETWGWLQDEAKKQLNGDVSHVHDSVKAHWQSIADGNVPFGYTVDIEE